MELEKLEAIFRDVFSSRRSLYGIRVTSAALDFSELHVEVTLLANERYCCSEAGCHLPPAGTKFTARLVETAAAHGLLMPDDVTIYWHGIVQAGAKLDVFKQLGLPPETTAHEWDAVMKQNKLTIL